jgi:hypothetical protein
MRCPHLTGCMLHGCATPAYLPEQLLHVVWQDQSCAALLLLLLFLVVSILTPCIFCI